MKVPKGDIVKHIALIISILAFLLLCILYPFLPGKYDGLAMPISIMVQLFGAAGLHLSIVGLLWLLVPKIRFILINISLYAGTFVMLILALFGMLIAGKIFGILTITLWVFILIQLKTKLKQLKATDHGKIIALPLYLISLPVLVLIFQLILRNPVTQWSRNRAMKTLTNSLVSLKISIVTTVVIL